VHDDHQRCWDDADCVPAVVSALSDHDVHEHDQRCRHHADDMSMTDTTTDEYTVVEDLPPPDVLTAIGQITTTWAQFDVFVSAALFIILNIDPVEFGIIIGRTESPTKLNKMHQIFVHRGEFAKAKVMKDAKELTEDLRPLRNALTHGYYHGRIKEEFFFILTTDFVFEEGNKSANEVVVVTRRDLELHLKRLLASWDA
jgi:hypothetical protein